MLLVVDTAREEEFVCHRDAEFVAQRQASIDEDLPPVHTPRTSGAPTFLVRKYPVLVPRLCGVVKQDLPVGKHSLMYSAKLDAVDRTSVIGRAPARGSSEPFTRAGPKVEG